MKKLLLKIFLSASLFLPVASFGTDVQFKQDIGEFWKQLELKSSNNPDSLADTLENIQAGSVAFSLIDHIMEWEVETFPAPASNWVHLRLHGSFEPGKVSVRILNPDWIVQFQSDKMDHHEKRIPVEFLTPGDYLLQLMLDEEIIHSHQLLIHR